MNVAIPQPQVKPLPFFPSESRPIAWIRPAARGYLNLISVMVSGLRGNAIPVTQALPAGVSFLGPLPMTNGQSLWLVPVMVPEPAQVTHEIKALHREIRFGLTDVHSFKAGMVLRTGQDAQGMPHILNFVLGFENMYETGGPG